MIRSGESVSLSRSAGTWRVGRLLGEGGQGRVYQLDCLDRPGRRLALKWYHAHPHPQRASLERLVERGSPGKSFLWPIEVVAGEDGSFGYTMELMRPRVIALSQVMAGRVDLSPSLAIRIALNLAHSFLQLHSQGLCYRDISFGNVLFDPHTLQIVICDNDNVGVDGESVSLVLGTRRFMAPEIVRGEAKPSTQTDLHALAVLIFYLLMVHHPLTGRREVQIDCWNEEAEAEIFGRDPVFIFDPDDDSNRPDPYEQAGVLANWAMHSAALREQFVHAFTAGLRVPGRRVRESVWRAELARALDRIVTCAECGRENFLEPARTRRCWLCGRTLTVPPTLRFSRGEVLLGARARVYRHHLRRDYDFDTVIGDVVKHPTLDRWGLANRGDFAWTVTVPPGSTVTVHPGQTLTLVADSVIDFGTTAATVGGHPV